MTHFLNRLANAVRHDGPSARHLLSTCPPGSIAPLVAPASLHDDLAAGTLSAAHACTLIPAVTDPAVLIAALQHDRRKTVRREVRSNRHLPLAARIADLPAAAADGDLGVHLNAVDDGDLPALVPAVCDHVPNGVIPLSVLPDRDRPRIRNIVGYGRWDLHGDRAAGGQRVTRSALEATTVDAARDMLAAADGSEYLKARATAAAISVATRTGDITPLVGTAPTATQLKTLPASMLLDLLPHLDAQARKTIGTDVMAERWLSDALADPDQIDTVGQILDLLLDVAFVRDQMRRSVSSRTRDLRANSSQVIGHLDRYAQSPSPWIAVVAARSASEPHVALDAALDQLDASMIKLTPGTVRVRHAARRNDLSLLDSTGRLRVLQAPTTYPRLAAAILDGGDVVNLLEAIGRPESSTVQSRAGAGPGAAAAAKAMLTLPASLPAFPQVALGLLRVAPVPADVVAAACGDNGAAWIALLPHLDDIPVDALDSSVRPVTAAQIDAARQPLAGCYDGGPVPTWLQPLLDVTAVDTLSRTPEAARLLTGAIDHAGLTATQVAALFNLMDRNPTMTLPVALDLLGAVTRPAA